MSTVCRLPLYVTAALLACATPAFGQSSDGAKKPLDHDAYDRWKRINAQAVSNDGRWALYSVAADSADATLTVLSLAGGATHTVERAESPRFAYDSRFVVFTLKPAVATVKELRAKRTRPAQLPPDTLGILDLTTGQIVRVERVREVKLPEKAGGWVAYQLGRAPEPDSARADSAQAGRPEPGRMPEPPAGERRQRPAAEDSARQGARRREEGTPLILRNLATGEERRIEDVVSYEFSRDGARLVVVRSNRAGDVDGAYVMDTRTGAVTTLLKGKGLYRQVAIDEAGRQVAFLSNTDEFADTTLQMPSWKLYYWDGRAASARALVTPATSGVPSGWWIADNGTVRFSPNGQRIFFGTAPRPEPEPRRADNGAPAEERVVVDVWNWKDPLLQPMQLRQLEQERRRTYEAMVTVRDGRMLQLAREDIPSATVALRGDGDFAIGTSNLPYRMEISWGESGSDVYRIDLRTGNAERLLEYARSGATMSPEGRYLTWFDGDKQAWFLMDLRDRSTRNISERIPHPVHNEQHDSPSLPGAYGSAGWTSGDAHFLIYDKHDIWAIDPTGRMSPRNITEGLGRAENLRFRYVRLDPEERSIDPGKDMLLSAFHLWNKSDGFYRDRVNAESPPARLVVLEKRLGAPRKAENADVVLLTRSDFQEFPDVWVTDLSFQNMRKLSNANPQQAEYRWGTAELVNWRSGDNEVLQGVLYKPEGFDPSRKYPMMVYFYERLSDNLHGYVVPAPGSSSVNISFYVSRGYLVFTPDIPYRVGYPGESAFKAVVPGVLSLIEKGFVDDKRIGVQGHSWGGYQIAYLITKTDIFRAAEAGAPVANMTSAYGGIRWESGMVRQFQYEKTQSRLGGTLWSSPMRFIENSPIFWADKVRTPLLMMHNDEDGAVPWEQGIEYFVALRRLSRPVWMLNYNGEAHGLRKEVNRKDWTIRMQQFFDHYLLDAPPPVWMEIGVPATEKGKNLGLDLVTRKVTNQ
jgi:dipeptidyl aminopeptidase/acylaminoacyl peptidase